MTATKHTAQSQPRKRIRRGKLAELFCVNIRTIDQWSKRGVIPQPHRMPGSRVPLWYEDEISNLKAS